jgi:glycosyltransferase involved in cell wall biosynthesis
VLHTHAAKAGALGRVAAVLSLHARPPVIIHTFHGHVLTGYFPRPISTLFAGIERILARVSNCVVAVSDEVRDDLIRLRVARPEQVVVLPLGFDFSCFDVDADERRTRRARLRSSLGLPLDVPVVTLVGRLEQIKRVDRFLRIASKVERTDVRFLVVGDGSLREKLQHSAEAQQLGDRLKWAGLRRDMPDVYFASDVLTVTSDNEGTAVTAIEAQAAGLPVVTTRVGGMSTAVADGESGYVVTRDDEASFGQALRRLLADPELAERLGKCGAARAREVFSLDQLLQGVDELYKRLLRARLGEPVDETEAV